MLTTYLKPWQYDVKFKLEMISSCAINYDLIHYSKPFWNYAFVKTQQVSRMILKKMRWAVKCAQSDNKISTSFGEYFESIGEIWIETEILIIQICTK